MRPAGDSAKCTPQSPLVCITFWLRASCPPPTPSLGPQSHQPINLPRLAPNVLAPLFHLHEAEIEDVERAVGAEFDVDGTFQADVQIVAAGGAFAGVADKILDGAIIHVHLNDFETRRPGEFEAAGIEGRPIAH